MVELKRNPIDFDDDCIEPIALAIILEALDYGIETSERRLESAGKMFPAVQAKGREALGTISSLREALAKAPQCKPGTGERAITPAPIKPAPESPKPAKERKLSELWEAETIYIDKKGKEHKFESPTEAARALHIKWHGASDMKHAFRRANFEVRGDGDEPERGGRFIIKQLGPIPAKYRLEAEEVPEKEEIKKKLEPPRPFVKVTTQEGEVRWEDAMGKPLPKEYWP